jgi:hypothetical protein
MATAYFPKIDPLNYQSFRRLPKNDFPETFEMWRRRQQLNQADQHRLKWHPNGTCVDVEVNSNEFAAHCRTTHSDCNLKTLDRFVAEKGIREGKYGAFGCGFASLVHDHAGQSMSCSTRARSALALDFIRLAPCHGAFARAPAHGMSASKISAVANASHVLPSRRPERQELRNVLSGDLFVRHPYLAGPSESKDPARR